MNIYESISKIMEEIPAIGKTKKNAQQGFMFRGIDDVMNAIQPLLSKNKVFIVPEILEQTREERTTAKGGNLIYSICKIKYVFYAEDGSHIEAITIGEGMDSGDKATNKAMAIAMKYALFQVFCIPTEEMKDPDAETQPESTPKTFQTTEPAQKAVEETNGEQVIDEIKQEALSRAIKKKGISFTQLNDVLTYFSYEKISDIKVKDYTRICDALSKTKGELA